MEKSPKRELLAYVSILVLVASSCFGQLSFAAFAAESAFVANIPTATDTATLTPIFTPSITWTPSSTYTASNTFTPSATFTASNTPTDTHTPTASFTPTRTFTPTQTFTPTPTLASGLASCIPTNTLREVGYVTNVIDGDTITVRINWVNYNVRYIGMDSPEGGAYYAWNATNRNRQLVQGQNVTLVTDVSNTDRYDRLLRYVIVGNTFVNHALVYEGFATALRYPPDIACASYFQTAENSANSSNRGMWAPTPTPLPPTTVPSTGGGGTGGTGGEGGDCHPSYPTVCIPYPPPDLNCGDISYRNFTVIGTDPHRFDGDNDGVGCET